MKVNSIKKYREAVGLKQAELAGRLCLATMTLSRYETGAREPRWSDVTAMATILGCTPTELMAEPETNPIQPLPQTG
ncbi:helix-turn-helix domain-containing protein [Cloacibacillus porcorum]|uniref:helix-turn-helix domain-containing protein n=1 Tax=Cloacibacillus porcorum TaxID=1197717 RepID=UPI003CD0CC15